MIETAPVREATDEPDWDLVYDVVVVGSGAAAFSAAITAARAGSTVAMLERAESAGGTTAKSGGATWIPNNSAMRARGESDSREDALAYLCRLGFPTRYRAGAEDFGIDPDDFALLEVFYDQAGVALDSLIEIGAFHLGARLTQDGQPMPLYPDYQGDLPENKGIVGRSVFPTMPPGVERPQDTGGDGLVGGLIMIETMRSAAERLGVDLRLRHHVVDVVMSDEGRAIGVLVHVGRSVVTVGARQAIIFGSGGFLSDRAKSDTFLRGPVFGGCAAHTNTGDFVDIGTKLGAELGNMTQAWWDQLVLELALRNRSTAEDVWFPFGDSMLQVNRYGHRVMNEKQLYNERGQIHHYWDPTLREYPNLLMFQIYDDAVAQNPLVWPYRGLVPMPGEERNYVISANTLDELADAVDDRLTLLSEAIGGVQLATEFKQNLAAAVQRFNSFAESGRDEDFGRGESPLQVLWQGPGRDGAKNPCMAPLADRGPYHCMILAGGALDTKGGPRINPRSQVMSTDGDPIPGLYGAGNCISSPLGQGYPGAGGTIGPALTFGYLAGLHAAREARR
jgi:succinate dehydrogenase/fumarate reductase flavoprotein subunit